MNLKNIFSRSATDEVRVPELEVQGDRLRVQRDEPVRGDEEDSRDEHQKPRDYRLPKTKWFEPRNESGAPSGRHPISPE